jgi:hypothetical protein
MYAWNTIPNNVDSIRLALINNGPLAIVKKVSQEDAHAMVLSGYIVDPEDGSIIWVLKDSFGDTSSAYKGFDLVKLPLSHIYEVYNIDSSVYLPGYELDTMCYDKDGDGYCWWGIGEQKPSDCPCSNELPDCNDNDPYVGPYDSCYYCTCNETFQSDTIYADTTEIWTGYTVVKNIIVIDSGCSLSISDTAAFTKNAGIIVMPGGRLYVSNALLTRLCQEAWRGIEVWGIPDTTQNFPGVQGKITLSNNSIIENAEIGILLGSRDSSGVYIYTHSGGIVQAENSSFINNTLDVEFLPYQNIHPYDREKELDNISSFKKCIIYKGTVFCLYNPS